MLLAGSNTRSRSMRGKRRLRGPGQERLLLLVGQARRMIECRVVSGRHRAAADRLLDALQLFDFFLRIVGLPIGKIERAACGVRGEVGRRNGRVPRRAAAGRVALVTGALADRVYLRVPAD